MGKGYKQECRTLHRRLKYATSRKLRPLKNNPSPSGVTTMIHDATTPLKSKCELMWVTFEVSIYHSFSFNLTRFKLQWAAIDFSFAFDYFNRVIIHYFRTITFL